MAFMHLCIDSLKTLYAKGSPPVIVIEIDLLCVHTSLPSKQCAMIADRSANRLLDRLDSDVEKRQEPNASEKSNISSAK
jgi:hypothetical protein